MWNRKTLALGAALGCLAVCFSPATVSRSRPSYPNSVCPLGDEAWELAKLQDEYTNTSQGVIMLAPVLLAITAAYPLEVCR
jgi:hypothetical protein